MRLATLILMRIAMMVAVNLRHVLDV